ncbi:SDR family oxidoreductase [Herbaspirillum robiniae]|uniref:SDR family oxidoreductase n=1 Tax=Herbaspirillum robiniae TaxID=2014887 RepID=A0ABX2M1H3_9BURK|nr:SDR family oxidoreductase [Herbaspirillum robiniae]NUU04236.1 SDR family oxidoreductase [Herbaspirillum robiniae]
MSSKFLNHVSVITGGSTGIGLAIAQGLLAEGARRVYITGRSRKNLYEALVLLGDAAVAIVSDVSDLADLEYLKTEIEKRGDRLDSIFANAGICEKHSFGATAEADYDRTFGINVKGVFYTVQTLLPLLTDGGSVVLTSSICSNNGMAELSVYNASKAAVRSFARTWTNDLRGRKIRVNALSPGFTRTPLMDNSLKLDHQQIDSLKEYVSQITPLGYMADPAEIASAGLFLASADARYITGIELTVDGGLSQI